MKQDEKSQDAAAAGGQPDAGQPAERGTDAGDAGETKKGKGRGKKDKAAAKLEELAAAKAQADVERAGAVDRLMRLQADFENYRKRMVRERAEVIRAANEDLMNELLPVLDHFDLALSAATNVAVPDAMTEGVRMVREQLLATLGKFGLEPIDADGQPFDPAHHEAISHLPSDTVPENAVLAQTRRGYRLGEKLLRPVQVVVSSGPAAGGATGEA